MTCKYPNEPALYDTGIADYHDNLIPEAYCHCSRYCGAHLPLSISSLIYKLRSLDGFMGEISKLFVNDVRSTLE